jgi:hypothetical protein
MSRVVAQFTSVTKDPMRAYAAEIGLAVQASECASNVVKELLKAGAATSVVDQPPSREL